jgi:hypothetical protein
MGMGWEGQRIEFFAAPAIGSYVTSRNSQPVRSLMRLTETDLRFVAETVATRRRDYDEMVQLLRVKPDLLEPMLQDKKLSDRPIAEDDMLCRVSPAVEGGILPPGSDPQAHCVG